MWPLSFFFSIIAGSLVLFNHCASTQTGDVALNKVIGASGRFLTVFDDAVLCSPASQTVAGYLVSRDSADSLKVRCSQTSSPGA
ncbi:hypothetical protein F5I97DRAFT_212575 [Phlebopus sp. FC_14]|nr:hypothetical protein F5I97DRAFT_212575 [Phlebopus sp. FC_14]